MRNKPEAKELAKFIQTRIFKKDGFMVGATGEYCKDIGKNHPFIEQYSGTLKQRAWYWKNYAERVWDSNGLIEGFYRDCTGVNISTYVRLNYANWCDKYRGAGMIPAQYRVPGAAVFWGNDATTLGQVAVLIRPVNASMKDGDWYIGEARSLRDGVVMSRLYDRKPTYWGIMSKYFTYPNFDVEEDKAPVFGDRELKKGCTGDDVLCLQKTLATWGYYCEETGEYDKLTIDAVKSFQTKVFETDPSLWTGKMDVDTYNAIYDRKCELYGYRCSDKNLKGHVNIRSYPSSNGEIICSSKRSLGYDVISLDYKYYRIKLNDYREAWVSAHYVRLTR